MSGDGWNTGHNRIGCRARAVAGLLSLWLVASCADRPPETGPRFQEGDVLPELVLTTLDGEQWNLDNYRDKVVVLNVWATWCAPCRKELPSLERLSNALDSERFAVIGLSIDDDDHLVREYLIDREIGLTSYIDREAKIADEILGVVVYPDTFIIAPGRRFVHHVPGDREWDSAEIVTALEAVYRGDTGEFKRIVSQ